MTQRFNSGDAVQVYDGDEDAWFDGYVESDTENNLGKFYLVRLFDGPVQFSRQITVIAVPYDRPEWIRRMSS